MFLVVKYTIQNQQVSIWVGDDIFQNLNFERKGYIMGLKYYDAFVEKITSRETDPINQARVKMLVYCLTSNLLFVSINVAVYFIQGPYLQFIRAFISFVIALFMLYAVFRWNIWKEISHFVCGLITLIVWSNLLFFVQGVNIPTIQFVFLIIVYSFYVHGLKWGVFYSFLNIVPIIMYAVFDGRNYFSITIPPQVVSQPAYIYVITYNFLIIIFLHYHFFKTFNRNITKATNAKNNLKTVNKALKKAMSELERSSASKMNFLSTMSHELRTPLNGVIGLSNVILMENPRADQKENLEILKFSAENLLYLINDILDLNKLQSDKIELESIPFYIGDLLKNSSGSLRLNAVNKGLDLHVNVDDALHDKLLTSDPTRLTQVLSNLVNNAVKFTEKGYVRLEAQMLTISDESLTIRFSVRDTGIGIEKDKQSDIFQPFTQASKSTTRQFGGTGLGLAIVKKILGMFHSDVHIESEPGLGSHFWFLIDFPYTLQKPVKVAVPALNSDKLKGLRVLVAEDNKVNELVIKKILSHWNIQPVMAENGLKAIEYLRQDDFDIILMDLHMPEMDGYEATRQIRLLEDNKASVTIIALTASVSDAIGNKVVESGMDGYLSKPFNPKDLYEKLLHFVSLKEPVE